MYIRQKAEAKVARQHNFLMNGTSSASTNASLKLNCPLAKILFCSRVIGQPMTCMHIASYVWHGGENKDVFDLEKIYEWLDGWYDDGF